MGLVKKDSGLSLGFRVHIFCWSLEGNRHVFRVDWCQLEMLILQNRQPHAVLKGKLKKINYPRVQQIFLCATLEAKREVLYSRSLWHIWRDLYRPNKSKISSVDSKLYKQKLLWTKEIILHEYRALLKFHTLCFYLFDSHTFPWEV